MKDRVARDSSQQVRRLVADQAAQWLIRLEECTSEGGAASTAERAEFADWLRTSPVHVAEYLNARATWEALHGQLLEGLPSAEELLRELGGRADPDVIPLPDRVTKAADTHVCAAERSSGSPLTSAAPRSRRRKRLLAVAAALLVTVATGLVAPWAIRTFDPNHAVLATDVGEQSTQVLPDGSSVVLNTRSRARLDWSEQYRDIYLEQGEVLFDVAHDPTRPFRVWTGHSVVRAIGTKFNVYRTADVVTVTVLDGRVEVTAAAEAPGSAANADAPGAARLPYPAASSASATIGVQLLSAGEQARIESPGSIHKERIPTPERVVAWQHRRLIFEGEPLSRVIAEFNRYHEKPLVLEDAALADKRIHGIFDSTDRASLVTFLEEFEGVRIEVRPDAVVVLNRG